MSYNKFYYAKAGCKDRKDVFRERYTLVDPSTDGWLLVENTKFWVPTTKGACREDVFAFETEEDAYWFFRVGYRGKGVCNTEADGTIIDPIEMWLYVGGKLKGKRECTPWPFWPVRDEPLHDDELPSDLKLEDEATAQEKPPLAHERRPYF